MKKKENIFLTVLITAVLLNLVCAFIFVPYLRSEKAFILGWDMRVLYASNFENLRTMLQNWRDTGTLPFWSWSSFLGNDFYSTKLFYFQDIFDYPFAFTDMMYSDIILIQTYLKFLTAGFSFLYYAGVNRYSRHTKVLGSLIFAFSAYNLQTMMHPFFGSFFVFLPLYFAGVDKYIMNRKKLLFIFMVFFLFINNYYLFYSVSLFTILYFIWRWDKEYHSMKGMMLQAVKLIGYYMIGFAMSGIVVLPEAISILSNSRVGNRSATVIYDSVIPYLDYLFGLFTPTSMLANRENLFSQLYSYTSENNSVMAVFLWISSLGSLLIPQCIAGKNKSRMNLTALIIISLVGLIPILSSVMHGFSEPSFRWLGSVSFLLAAMILPYIETLKTDKRILALSTVISSIILAAGTACIIIASGGKIADYKDQYYLVLICLPTLLVTAFGLWKEKRSIIWVSILAELCLVSYYSYFGNPAFSSINKVDIDHTSVILGEKGFYQKWMNDLDGKNPRSMIRNYVDSWGIYWGLSTNYNLYWDLMGVMGYDSTYTASTNDLIALDPEHVVDYLPWTFNVTNPDIMTLTSTKYAIVAEESQVPFKNAAFKADYAAMKVYENLDYYSLGKTYTKAITYDEYDPSQSGILSDVLICHSEDLKEITQLLGNEEIRGFEEAVADGNNLYATITVSEDGFAVMAVPWHQGWSVLVNGNPVKTYKVSGGLTGIPVYAGTNKAVMTFTPPGLKPGAYLSAAGFAGYIIALILQIFLSRKSKPMQA